MAEGNKTGKLVGIILLVLAIVVAVALVGTLCTCLCTCGTCIGFNGCMPLCSGIEGYYAPDAAPETVPPVTHAPAETAAPTAAASLSPLDLDWQQPAATSAPAHADPSEWVRPKKVQYKNDGTDTVTVLVLMNGSDLESQYGEATDDLLEMVRAAKNDRVKIVIETVGTKKWSPRFGVSPHHAQRWRVTDTGLTLLDDTLPQLDTTIPSTLSDFIRWGVEAYPADRYILLLWDHGGGPVYGFGYDEYQPYSATLTIDEMQTALSDSGVYFDMIGMDCCLMSSLEVCFALYDYCDYTLLSEDFEPGCGWSHEGWLSALANNPAIETPALAKIAIDDSVRAAEKLAGSDDGMTLALIDESYLMLLYPAWIEFAYANEDTLLSANYSQLRQSTGRVHPRLSRAVGGWFTGDGASLDDYCITDMLSLAANIRSDASDQLAAALDRAIVHFNATSDETTLSGLSVTLPYGDDAFYRELRRVFLQAGIDPDYIDWLQKFVSVNTGGTFYDFGTWSGWDDYVGGYDWSDWNDAVGEWVGFGLDEVLGWLFGGE